MNIITFTNNKEKSKTIKRRGTITESMSYITGYLTALHERGVNIDTINISHEYINSSGITTDLGYRPSEAD